MDGMDEKLAQCFSGLDERVKTVEQVRSAAILILVSTAFTYK